MDHQQQMPHPKIPGATVPGAALLRTTAPEETIFKEGETIPLHDYLASLMQSGEYQRLLRHVGVYIQKAGVAQALPGVEGASEVLQDAFVEAMRSAERFDAARSPRAWLLGIANNIVRRHRERIFRRNKHEVAESDLASGATAPLEGLGEEEVFERFVASHHAMRQASPEEAVVAAQEVEAILGQLTPEARQIIELNVFHEMRADEVAQVLGISAGNARVRFCRAMKQLRIVWQEAGREAGRDASREEKSSDE